MAAVLNAVYTVGVALVALVGLFGVWWVSRDRTAGGRDWLGLAVAVVAGLFVLALAVQFLLQAWA